MAALKLEKKYSPVLELEKNTGRGYPRRVRIQSIVLHPLVITMFYRQIFYRATPPRPRLDILGARRTMSCSGAVTLIKVVLLTIPQYSYD